MGRLTPSANNVPRGSLVRRAIAVGLLGGFMASLLSTSAGAVHDLGLFELDGNAVQQPATPPPGDDWDTLFANGGNAQEFTGILPDIGADGGTQFHGGGSKDDLDITDWLWNPGEPLDKDDITNAYAAAYTNTVDTGLNNIGDTIVYFGLDRFDTNGSAQVGFWFLQDPTFGLSDTASGGGFEFNGAHQNNDVLVQVNFSNGGVIGTAAVWTWQDGELEPVAVTDADCLTGTAADDAGCAVVNKIDTPAPWPYTNKDGGSGTFTPSAFFEAGLNLTRLVPAAACFTSFVAETRSSTPFNSQLKDFVTDQFEPCAIEVVKTGDLFSKVGDDANYTVTINNTGNVTLFKDDITDTLLGNITTNGVDQVNANVLTNTCGASLTAGASCTITYRYTVPAGAPDPLPNTVNIVYRGLEDLTGSAVSATDDHSVQLFQPSVNVDKTGDTLSKVGDPANYIITVTNTSSADSPSLVNGTIVDSLLGNLLDPANPFVTASTCTATLAVGASCTINATRTVLAGDPDPLPNTVTVHYNPQGFPNDITDSDDHSVSLFEPSVTVDKTGDTLSKVGDPVNYTITVTNTSSADSPSLVNGTIVDTLLGNLLDPANPFVTANTCTATLALGANCTISATRTVQAGDPDPLPNTVTVHYNPSGFPNDITDSDDHSVNLFQPSVTVVKTGDATGEVGQPVDYTITITNGSSADSPGLVNGTIVDSLLGNLLDPANPFVTANTCTATLAIGASCTINATRTVQAGDPDPLPNTVTVHYNPSGFPNDITDSDDHSVNLFQPSVTVDKTGDTLSKVGDPANYTITISNTSSAGSPSLVNGTVVDTLLGNLLDPANAFVTANTCTATLAVGATCTISATRTVQAGDPDPLPNTVTVTYNPQGSTNVVTDSDDHSVQLFQPSVNVVKTGDTTGVVGQPVTYTITITNGSSADSPGLVNGTIVDTLLGNLLDPANPFVTANTCTATLAIGASCTINATRTVQAGDPDPLPNTVTVHYNPSGFPNDITDSDDHSVNLFQPSVTVDKTGDTLSKVGDPANYTITISNTSSAGSPSLVNGTVVDTLLGNLLDPANAFVTANTCTATLAVGATCTISATRTVQAGDPDPLPNTVTVTYNSSGFTNVVTDSDDHSVNLFQPSVNVVKTGDTTGVVGQPVTYTITVTNTSSADSPALTNAAVSDTVAGNLLGAPNANVTITTNTCTAAFSDGFAPAESCSIVYDYIVQAGGPDPLPNTVTVHFNPTGFPNDITDNDDHSVDVIRFLANVQTTATNLVGNPHTFVISVQWTDGSSTPAVPDGSTVAFTWTGAGSVTAPSQDATSCITVGGQCEVTVNSSSPGSGSITVTSVTATIGGKAFGPATVANGGLMASVEGQLTATKTWITYELALSPGQAINQFPIPEQRTHEITATLTGFPDEVAPVAGQTLTLTLTSNVSTITAVSPSGVIAADGKSTTCVTDANGQCVITLTATDPGIALVQGSYGALVNGVSQTFTSNVARKAWVSYAISVTPTTATNIVGFSHTVTVLTQEFDGETVLPMVGQKPVVTITPSGGGAAITPTADTCQGAGTTADGTCTVTFVTNTPGTYTITAVNNVLVSVGEGQITIPVSSAASKTYVDFQITMSADSTNPVGSPHTFTVTVRKDSGDGQGFLPLAGAVPAISTSAFSGTLTNGCASGTDAQGQCTVTVNSNNPESVTVTAAFTGTVGSQTKTVTDSAIKTWVITNINVTKVANTSVLNIAADQTTPVTLTWTVTVTNTTDIPAENVKAVDTLPAGWTFSSYNGNGLFTCSASGQTVTCNATPSTLPGNATISFTITATAPAASLADQSTVVNAVQVSTTTGETTLVDNTSSSSTSVTKPPIVSVLPPTGGDPWRATSPALLLTLAGIGFWLVSRRRRQTA